MNEEMAATASMKFAFTGQSHQIDANTLINALFHYMAVINAANAEFGGGGRSVNIKVNALKEGSFVVDLTIVENAFMGWVRESLPYLADLTTVVTGIFAAYKIFKGHPAKTEEERSSLGIDNAEIKKCVLSAYNRQDVREAVSKSFETVSQDSSVDGLYVVDARGGDIGFRAAEFADLIYVDFGSEEDVPGQRVVTDNDAVLVITRLSFGKGDTWSFTYNGFRVKIPVKDDKLSELVENGERFGKGDAIRVSLDITQQYVKEYKTYVNKSFRIRDFKEHIEYGGNPLPQNLI